MGQPNNTRPQDGSPRAASGRPLASDWRQRAGSGYFLVVVAVAVAALARWLLQPYLGRELLYITFFLPVVLAAWWGGFGPAFTATILGAASAWVLFVPKDTATRGGISDVIGLIVFLTLNLLIAGVSGAMRSAQREMQKAAADASQQRETLQTTLASIGDAVIATDAAGRVSFLNPVAERLTGWPAADAIGQPLESVFHIVNEETGVVAENPVRRVLDTGQVIGLANHTVLIARDGTRRSIDDSAAPIQSPDGDIRGVVLVFRDVTQRRGQERKQHESADQFRRMVEGIHDCALFLLDTQGRVMTWNAGAERIKGYRAEEIIGRHFSCFYPPEAIARDWPGHELKVARERGWFIDEGPRVRKDGSQFHASVVITALHDEHGSLWGFSKVTRDLGERQRDAQRLRQAEERLRLAVDVAGLGTWDWDLRSGQSIWSDEQFRLMGYEPFPDGIAHVDQWSQRVHPEDRERVLRELEASKRNHTDFHPQHRLIRADNGQTVWVNVMGRFLYNEQGEAVRMIGANWNVTDQKEAENALRRSEESLRAADRRKDEFLATLAHELRNPLAPLRNGLQVMRMAAADPQAVEQALAVMERQVEHLVRLVDDLLEISRIVNGKVELRKERHDLVDSVRSAVETSRPLMEEAAHQLAVSVPERPLWVEGDPVRLSQVIANLLNNSAKYTPRGGRIQIDADAVDGRLRVRVRDNGRGIESEMLPRIFEMFTQVDQDHRLTQGGLGVGLALVKSLVEMHGGTVAAHSEGPGRGAEFTIWLPAAERPHPAASAPPAAGPTQAATSRILVVDDNRDAATALAALLKLMGNEVFVEHDGPGALNLLDSARPDLVLLDLGMPGMSGYEVAARIRQSPDLAGLRLVALTGWGQANDRQRTKEAGFDEHLVKPVDLAALRDLLSAARR
jgi:PAS domain S-box-containing protein